VIIYYLKKIHNDSIKTKLIKHWYSRCIGSHNNYHNKNTHAYDIYYYYLVYERLQEVYYYVDILSSKKPMKNVIIKLAVIKYGRVYTKIFSTIYSIPSQSFFLLYFKYCIIVLIFQKFK